MKKSYLVMAAAAALFAACSSNDLAEEKSPQTTQQTVDEQAVNFGAYVNRATTRAGWTGTLTTSTGTNNLQTEGFGVFGYYTNNELYNEASIPNFFYNQKVEGADWHYSPIKYWPNEFGTSAISEGQDKLTFFAYAPWVEVDLSTGIAKAAGGQQVNTGIIALTRNTAHGDPFVKYYADFTPANRVDLCWGVAATNFNSSVDDTNAPNSISQGHPYIDVTKTKTTDKINFDFKHALASLNVQIDADIDELSHGTVDYLDTYTKIYVRKVIFEGFTDKGMLNLNADAASTDYTPKWYDLSGLNELNSGKVTIYDGRRDGKEGQANADVSNETPKDLNPDIIQKETVTTGVPATAAVNLFDNATATEPVFVIPTGEPLKVTIVYDVETADPNLPSYLSDGVTRGSTIENTISKDITLSSSALTLKAGKAYKVTLHLGMTSVKFDASVTEWPTPINEADKTDLPVNNNGTFAAAGTHSITVPAAATGDQSLTISGLTGSSLAYTSGSLGSLVTTSPIPGSISSGESVVTYTLAAANTTVKKETANMVFTESGGSATVTTVNVTRQPHALGLSVNGNPSGTTITLRSTASGLTDWNTDLQNITISKNGSSLTKVTTTPTSSSTEFKLNDDGTITLGTAVAPGDEYVITVQEGDAAAETVTVVVGDVAANATQALGDFNMDGSTTKVNYIYGLTPGSTLVVGKSGEAASLTTATLSATTVPASGVVAITITTANNTTGANMTATVAVTESGKGSSLTTFTLTSLGS